MEVNGIVSCEAGFSDDAATSNDIGDVERSRSIFAVARDEAKTWFTTFNEQVSRDITIP